MASAALELKACPTGRKRLHESDESCRVRDPLTDTYCEQLFCMHTYSRYHKMSTGLRAWKNIGET
jgi:hypothetical protein